MKSFKKFFDVNKDGKIDSEDLKAIGKVVTATAAAAGITAVGAAAAGQAIVGATAAKIGSGAATAAGVIAGYGLGSGASTAYMAVKAIQIKKAAHVIAMTAGKSAIVKGASFDTALVIAQHVQTKAIQQMAIKSIPQVAKTTAFLKKAGTAGGGAAGFVSELAAGQIAGLPIVKSAATSLAVARGEVFVIGGIAFSVKAAIALGLISVVVIAGYSYFVFNGKGRCQVKKGKAEVDIK